MVNVDYGSNFKTARNKRGISQADAAAALNVTASFLSQIESNKKKPSVDLIFKAAQLYGVEESCFFKTKEEVDIAKLSTKENHEFINDLGNLSPEELKQKYNMQFIGQDITDSDIKAVIAYLKTLKDLG